MFVEQGAGGVAEQFGFGGQDPPAETLVLLALRGGGGGDVGVGEVGGGSGQDLEDPALGVRGAGGVVRAQPALQGPPDLGVEEVGAGVNRVRRRW